MIESATRLEAVKEKVLKLSLRDKRRLKDILDAELALPSAEASFRTGWREAMQGKAGKPAEKLFSELRAKPK